MPRSSRVIFIGLVVVLLVSLAAGPASGRPTAEPPEPYRPAVHFSPQRNWMNDPNGLVYDRGTYHLFFQHNPDGTRWGNMSWGHATSTDLVHWREQPIAIRQSFDDQGRATEDIFSGSVVVDSTNSSGFGTRRNPPLVAVYTSNYTQADPQRPGIQAQSLAYSTDQGRTWTKYAGNPVLDRDSANFRDPKVIRYDGPGGPYWVMVAVEATEHRVLLHKSTDLKHWTYLSSFGPANATGGVWECPDLFPLRVEGSNTTKWVMVVNLNPGGVNGSSAGQYFVGDFDGTTFSSESTDPVDQVPAGTLLAGFDGSDWAGWTATNESGPDSGPWGSAPASGTLSGQSTVSGAIGPGLVNGFVGGDWPVGTLSSPAFTLDRPYLNFLVGGGRHPRVGDSQPGNEPPAGRLLFDGFEYGNGENLTDHGWTLTGDFEPARNPSTAGGEFFLGAKRLNTWEGGPKGDDNQGTLTSPSFTLDGDYLSFLIGGGRRTDHSLEARLIVDGQTVASQTGADNGRLNWASWDVRAHRGATAQLQVVDRTGGGWGHLTLDHVVLGPTPAKPRSEQTTVDLVVDGQVVRSATGSNSEVLDWASWDVSEFRGRTARLQVVDANRWDWGHLLLDQVMLADQPARLRAEGYDWLDWGRDYYAAVSFANLPNRRVMLGWMNNWDYAQDIPTSTWRSSMAFPREVTLVRTPDGPRLRQQPVRELDRLRTRSVPVTGDRRLTGSRTLPVRAETAEITAQLRPGTAESFGLTVLGRGDQRTTIGYDTRSGRLSIDRRSSGATDFAPNFASLDSAPVSLRDGKLELRILIDRASVEVFAQGGSATLADQVFPTPGSDEIGVFATGGTARLDQLTVTPLRTAR